MEVGKLESMLVAVGALFNVFTWDSDLAMSSKTQEEPTISFEVDILEKLLYVHRKTYMNVQKNCSSSKCAHTHSWDILDALNEYLDQHTDREHVVSEQL
jgi:hypothetical protein